MLRPKTFTQFKRFGVEYLENRLLLAGNITAKLMKSGTLSIRGDSSSNDMVLTDNNSVFTLTGTNSTTINGKAEPAVLRGVKRIVVNSKSGDDSIVIQGGRTSIDNVQVQAGPGSDVIEVTDFAAIQRDLRITGSSGNDHIKAERNVVGRNTIVTSQSGNDRVEIHDSAIAGLLTANTSSGTDVLDLKGIDVGRNARVNVGAHDDIVQIGASRFRGALRLDTQSGNDRVFVNDRGAAGTANEFEKAVMIRTSQGNDRVVIDGDLRDGLATRNSFGSKTTILLGGGDDTFTLGNTDFQAAKRLTMDGQGGRDVFNDNGNNTFPSAKLKIQKF